MISPTSGDSLVYMYGISDFWVDIFEDTPLVEAILKENTIQLGEVYSYFLQRSSGISLADIQERYQTRIKLLLLSEDDLVDPGDPTRFNVDPSIISFKNLSNRPILPTSSLENHIHYDVMGGVLSLNKTLAELKFPSRVDIDGKRQYALWMCDVEIDDKWIDNTFGRLVGFESEDAIFNYKSFLEGVYYLYGSGPNIAFLERGVNLAMGMPYAREDEKVLNVLKDDISGNWVVFTMSNSYVVPYGFRPEVKHGDFLHRGKVISTWVEVIDHTTSGGWWYDIYLPKEVLHGQDTKVLGRALKGTQADGMMESFLKHHMFEVLITQPNGDSKSFNTAKDLVMRSKPSYTFPVFVWKSVIEDDRIHLDEQFSFKYITGVRGNCISAPPVGKMDRSTDDGLFVRGLNWYNRTQGGMKIATLVGYGDWEGNAGWSPQFDTVSEATKSYLSASLRSRSSKISPRDRGVITRGWRGFEEPASTSVIWNVPPENVYGSSEGMSFDERDLTPLYMLTKDDMVSKMVRRNPKFKLGSKERIAVTGLNLVEEYDEWMTIAHGDLTTHGDYDFAYSSEGLDISFSQYANQIFVPKREDMLDSDGLPIMDGTIFLTRSTRGSWVCQWLRDGLIKAPTIFPVEDADRLLAEEIYTFDDIGEDFRYKGVTFNAGVYSVNTPRLVEELDEVLVIVDGKYTPESNLSIVFKPASTDSGEELNASSRTYIQVADVPVDRGYLTNISPSPYAISEETISRDDGGNFTISIPDAEGVLVWDGDLFREDFYLSGDQLEILGPSEITVRYTGLRGRHILTAGSTEYMLSEDSQCKIFTRGVLLEDWQYTRSGTIIILPFEATDDLYVRYEDVPLGKRTSPITRSMVERNSAKFLLDRSREDGVYDDGHGQTVFINRSGVPILEDSSTPEYLSVSRRLH